MIRTARGPASAAAVQQPRVADDRGAGGQRAEVARPKFPCFFLTSLWPSEGSRRSNRAAVTPIGQQNPPGRLKLLVLHKKQAKIPTFILPISDST